MKEEIRRRARELGFDDCRFTTAAGPRTAGRFEEWLKGRKHGEMAYLQRNAQKRVEPQLVLPGAKSIIVLAASYATAADCASESPNPHEPLQEPVRNSRSRGEIARYARYQDYHDVLGARLKQLCAFMDELGGAGTRSLWYVDTGPILERDLAQRAGLGFIGKHTNLISRKAGNWIFLSEILTTIELAPDSGEINRCGTCSRCIGACPTNAITAPFQLDARRCISYLTIELKGSIREELRPLIGNRVYGCDDCLAVCPWNRFAAQGSLMREYSREDLGSADLIELLSLDDAGFKSRFAGTPILRAKRRGFLRNVCVALGNAGDESALPALERAATDPEPLIAEHARWAIRRIKKA
ncbi:MAG TPA: tRNA epoxyqueuosine(34) reductase QueG [Verrucomicrobiae bacterium]|nr:tRNA epoxyqueuosine(34) reductase QueG [Verrucomicrobiae bacterium]